MKMTMLCARKYGHHDVKHVRSFFIKISDKSAILYHLKVMHAKPHTPPIISDILNNECIKSLESISNTLHVMVTVT